VADNVQKGLEALIEDLTKQLRVARVALQRVLESKHDIKAGDRVRSLRKSREGKEFIVARVEFVGSYNSKPWLYAFLVKANGDPSTVTTNLMSEWEKV
jgi:hypothetical protein